MQWKKTPLALLFLSLKIRTGSKGKKFRDSMLKARQNLSQSQTPSDYPVKAEVGVFLSYSHYPHSCSSTHMQRSRSENLSSWWKEEEVENDSHTSGGRVLPHCLCLLHVIMLTQCGDRNQHKHDCCFTCHHHPRSAPGNHSLRVKTASWQTCTGHGTDQSSRVPFQNTFN